MTCIQCDRCKRIINPEEEKIYKNFTTCNVDIMAEYDLCESCYESVKAFIAGAGEEDE